jgi:TRAP-type C4-dicarboxylate transport system permease small subunit
MSCFIQQIARLSSLFGGMVLAGLILLTCLSVAGRLMNSLLHLDGVQAFMPGLANALIAAGIGPITGDYEIVQAGMACVIFAFLPLCQLQAGHASVDIFTDKMPKEIRKALIFMAEIAFALTLILVAWQLANGLGDKYRSHETTALLEFPVWYGYAVSLVMAIFASFVAVVMAYFRALELLFGQPHKLRDEKTLS